ncbi:MAG: cellulose synthase [Hydrocarboniphaga sp.]|uniref:cellulose synthase subunit BcsC-related outer membrane protein n=1 Tax=Hydrocarboniphaga sp. TaxID=2033016 RepID=UPI0026358E2C|nr:cellulose synthase subunit BcsC-related outer membrane protein [Hydrocarboniphaga sp.]MDB5970707.1 cellulose synthase [Hydrocarboniphaga sp.]
MVRTVKSTAASQRAVLTAILLSITPWLMPSLAQAQASTDQLVTQAHYWEDKGRYDLARESWLKLLRVSPDNADALSGLAMAEAKSGRGAAAQVYLDRLRTTHPDAAGTSGIEDAIRSGSYDQDKLQAPRALARDGKFDEAVAAYRQIFNEQIPDGRLGLEYYQTLAGVADGWEPARAGIDKLAKAHPDEPLYQLALAQHLTYREETRREGISSLQKLAGQPSIAAPAEQAWAQGLIWLGAKPGDEHLYQSYLANHQNAQVSARLETLRSGQAAAAAPAASGYPGRVEAPRPLSAEQIRGQQVQLAYDKLNENQLTEAGQMFEQILASSPGSDDAMGGLGIVRLRQERYGEARQYLQQATAMAPKRAARWKEALGTSRFWEQVRAGQAARTAGDLSGAERMLRQAITADPAIAAKETSVKSSLADILAEDGDVEGAEKLYREVLASKPDDIGAMRGLIAVLVKRNRLPEALNLADRLPPDQKDELGNLGALKGQYLRDQAKLASDAKDDAQAETLLKQALLEDPESPWTRLDLSRIYQRQHRTREANTLIDGLLTGGKTMPEALYIKALLVAENENWLEGLQILEQIPYEQRTQPMADLQRRLWVRYQTTRAGVYTRYGRPQEAAAILQQVEPFAQDSPELLGALATGLADIGEDGRALNYIRQALSRQSTPDVGLRMQYAGLLFKLRQDAEFEVVMEELIKYQNFDQQQSLDLANLRIAYRLRQADLVREEGNLARAYEYLEPLLRVNPNDPRLVMALARLYNDAKEYDKAAELYKRALQTDPNNLDAYKGAVSAALSMNQPEQAQALLDDAIRLDPQNPRLYALAARTARARGEDGRALQLYQQALRLDQEHGGDSEFGDGRYTPQLYLLDPSSSPVNNPFYGPTPPSNLPRPQIGGRYGAIDSAPPAVAAASVTRSAPAVKVARLQAAPITGAEKKKQLTRTYSPAPEALASNRIAPRRRSLQQGDIVLTTLPRWWKSGRLIKVSTYPEGSVAQVPPAPVTSTQGWVQTAPGRYSYGVQTVQPSSVPVQPQYAQPVNSLPAYVPRQLVPSQQLSVPRPKVQPRSTLRDEVLRDMGEITGQPAMPYVAPSASSAPRLQTMGPAQQQPAQPSGYPAGAMRAQQQPLQPQYAQQIVVVPPQQYTVTAPPPGVGATEADYARQGLRVLPGSAPVPVYSTPVPAQTYVVQVPAQQVQPIAPMPTYVPAPVQAAPAPIYGAPIAPSYGMQLRSDPALATPDFVLARRRPTADQPNEVLREIADINAKRTSYASFGLSIRSRDGQAGLDKLTDLETPVEFSVAGVQAGRFKLRAVPTFLDAGSVSGSQIPLFGAMALVDPNTGYDFSQSETGIAVGAAYEIGDFKADFGSSPLGFPVETLVGGINWRPHMDKVSFKLDLSRRPVTDSLLSYAGTVDPATGNTWGGVTKTGGRLDVAYDLGQFGVYVDGAYHVLDGENVARNSVYEIGGGFYARALDRRDMRITYGVNMTTFFYNKNLRRFTYGQGGYFSPQSYFAIAIPVEWSGGRDRFSYKLNAAIGIQSFKEDASAAFPNNSDLQTAIETFVIDNPDTTAVAGYPSQNSTGIGFNFGGAFEYLISPNLIAGARFGVDNARDYEEAQALGYIRFAFSGQRGVANPPATLMPFYDFGDPTE